MSWQEDLHRYMKLREKFAELESREDCTCSEFNRCSLCEEVSELGYELNRIRDRWDDFWACKLYRICQNIDPATPVHFDKEAACTTQK